MSCTENESGPFVVFFLPAVVGCLTILLARRWAYSQVTNTSSTAISRRRKIIKDPLIKRPLPPIANKMMPQVSKKATGASKKGSLPVSDEDMNNGKRVGRPSRLPPAPTSVNLADMKLADGPIPPKHIPFPYLPQDGILLFETMTFIFTLVATGLQFLNLYRTAWWLPHSYTNQAMQNESVADPGADLGHQSGYSKYFINKTLPYEKFANNLRSLNFRLPESKSYNLNFYLIDPHLVAFIVTIIFRRLLLSLSLALLSYILAPKLMPAAIVAARMFILGVVLGALAWCTYFIALKYPLVKIFYLCYPAVIYFLLFGFESSPFLELVSASSPPVLHCCSTDARQARAEVDALREDFNMRVKKIIFNSVVGAYYSSFIPCCFAQSYLYYDVYAASQQVAFVWGGLFGRTAAQLVSAAHCDVPHRAALHLGRWRRTRDTCTSVDDTCTDGVGGGGGGDKAAVAWCPRRTWPRGARVWHAGQVFVAATNTVAAVPDLPHHARFHAVFINPSMLLCLLLCLQLSLIVLQLCLLFSSIAWHNFLSIVILLFINYYTLFKMVRDYLVAWKVYKAENMIQDKNGAIPAN